MSLFLCAGKLDALLSLHKLTDSEAKQTVLTALKAEVTRIAAQRSNNHSSSSSSIGTSTASDGLVDSVGRFVLSVGCLETAFAAVCKAHVPRPTQPTSRTKEEVCCLEHVYICICLLVMIEFVIEFVAAQLCL